MNNQLILIGHVGKAPVSTTFPDTENKLAKFSIAVNEYSSKKENQEPMWVEVESWNGLAERVMQTITPGREVAITGRLSISKYFKEVAGEKFEVKRPVVKLSGFHLCGPKPKTSEPDAETDEEEKSEEELTA